MSVKDKEILAIALPSIVSNITVPLLGLIDVAIVGHLGSPAFIGAIAVGGMLFNMIYWIFGFLRMGTSGMTAQLYGANDLSASVRLLMRSLSISLFIALLFIVIQHPLRLFAFNIIEASPEVISYASVYYHICIWGTPAMLSLYSFTGWFIGMQNSRFPMYIAIVQNMVNIVASLLFVYVFDMKIEGVAYGTLIAQYAGLFMAIILYIVRYSSLRAYVSFHGLYSKKDMSRFFSVNKDIFFRTLCLVAVTVFFTSTGAKYGDTILAVNTLLMQLFTIFSYIMDGFAYAAEAVVGKYIGASDKVSLRATVNTLFKWGVAMAVVFTLFYITGGERFLSLLTDDETVLCAASPYFYWALVIPIAGFSAFLLDGICIGATATSVMLRSMFVSAVSFFGIYYSMHFILGNHALWLSFISYLALRGIVQSLLLRRMALLH